jgi:hypothetical protein
LETAVSAVSRSSTSKWISHPGVPSAVARSAMSATGVPAADAISRPLLSVMAQPSTAL